MSKCYLLFAEGFEECEGLVTLDILRRAGLEALPAALACLLFGALIGGITVGVMAAKHKTVRRQPAANSYVVQDSLHLTQQSDLFLYANTTRTARPKDNDRSGSDAHSGSGGSSFGGGGGKF